MASAVGVHPFLQRPGDLCSHHFTAGGVHQCLHRALAAVSHWFQDGFGIGDNALYPLLNGVGNLQSGEVSLKPLGGNNDFHGIALSYKCQPILLAALGVAVGLVKNVHDFKDRYWQLLLAHATGKLHDAGGTAGYQRIGAGPGHVAHLSFQHFPG